MIWWVLLYIALVWLAIRLADAHLEGMQYAERTRTLVLHFGAFLLSQGLCFTLFAEVASALKVLRG